MTMTWGDYFANIWLALQGKKNCSKEDLDEVKESFSNNGNAYGIIVIIPALIIALSYSFGAAMLSYHYNVYKGNSGAVVWAILENKVFKVKAPNFLFAKAVGVYLIPALIVLFFYS